MKSVAGRDVENHDKALAEIRQVREIESIPSFEKVTLGRDAFDAKLAEPCLQITLAYLQALHELPNQPATESIARHAVLAPGNKARDMAINELKTRKQANYLPMLLSNLQMPIESTFSVVKDPDGSVRYAHSLYREGPDQDQSYDANYFTFQQVLTTEDDRDNARRVTALRASSDRVATTAKRSEGKYSTQAEKTESLVRQANEEAEQRAAKIIPVLAATTGQSFETPKQWWDWYRDSNEYFMSEHPVNYQYYSDTDSRVYNGPEDRYASQHSCFGKGTPVWTKTGLKPIEALQQGDLVLSQNTETGELRFEPVLLRHASPGWQNDEANHRLVRAKRDDRASVLGCWPRLEDDEGIRG